MNILKGIARWLCAFILGAVLSGWIVLATMQATLLNRTVTEGWLVQSGAYNNVLPNFPITLDSQNYSNIFTSTVLNQAFSQTFPPAYLKQSTEAVLNSTYDWLEGKASKITFSINIQDRATALGKNLAALVTPELAKLPVCGSRLGNTDSKQITCLPQGISASDYASDITTPSGNGGLLSEPITQDSFAQQHFPQITWLPAAVQWAELLTPWLLVAAVVLAGLYVLASDDKIRGIVNVGRQIAINTGITLIGGLFVWYTSTSIDLSSTVDSGNSQLAMLVTTVINPLARIILPDIGKALSIYSGILFGISIVLWIGAFIWRHKRDEHKVAQPARPLIEQKPPKADLPLPSAEKPKPVTAPTPPVKKI